MSDRIRADLFGNFDLALRDQRAGDARPKQVLPLIEGVRPEHGKHEILDERLSEVVDEDLLHAEHLGLFAGWLQFLSLTEISREGDHLASISGLQPTENDAGIQPAGIGEHYFIHVLHGHGGEIPWRSVSSPPEYGRGGLSRKKRGRIVRAALFRTEVR